MTDERCKQLMEQVGMPNSRSLMVALFQVANETEQMTRAPLLASIAELERLRAEDLSHFLDMAAAIETLGIKLADANEIIEQRNKMLSAQRLSCR